jgi:hypothetical protein
MLTGEKSSAGKFNGADINSVNATLASAVNAKFKQMASPRSISVVLSSMVNDQFDVKVAPAALEEAARAISEKVMARVTADSRKVSADLKKEMSAKGPLTLAAVTKAAAKVM